MDPAAKTKIPWKQALGPLAALLAAFPQPSAQRHQQSRHQDFAGDSTWRYMARDSYKDRLTICSLNPTSYYAS